VSAALRHHAQTAAVTTPGRGTVDITAQARAAVDASGVQSGLCNVFVHHTSASLILCENADPTVRADLERFFARLVPDGDPLFEHTDEGPDDMPAHVRSVLTQASLSIPVAGGALDLGTWQGIYLWEHRRRGHKRRITISVVGS
jgi:secondary thiamine-phosphate synthase enzyme